MDFEEIQKALAFLNWQMVVAVAVMVTGWVQLCKPYLGDPVVKGVKIPVTVLFLFGSALAIAHFTFDVAGIKHEEVVALYHGFASALLSSLGYELLKGTKFGLRSGTDLKNGKEEKKP